MAHLFGQDGPDILAELGFHEPAIEAMIDGGVLVRTAGNTVRADAIKERRERPRTAGRDADT